MTTLRSLLYNQGQKNQCNQSFCTTAMNPNACMFVLVPHCNNTVDTSYNGNCMIGWCVPADAKCCVTFEIIGGGGGAGGGCCCMQGTPGGAGAYAVKTLLIESRVCSGLGNVCCAAGANCGNLSTGTTPSTLCQGTQSSNNPNTNIQTPFGLNNPATGYTYTNPGCCYCMQAGSATDCSVGPFGCVGCNSWVQGQGLCNFCADGGIFGRNCCFWYWSAPTTASQCCGQGYITASGVDFVSTCACYYGADYGAPGHAGFSYSMCGGNTTSCYWKQGVGFPGGLINQGGGHVLLRQQGDACFSDWIRCISSIGFPVNADTGGTSFVPGQGGIMTTVCGGGCCCGYPGSAGFVRITYR